MADSPKGRVRTFAAVTLAAWAGSTAAFATGRPTLGAVLGVVAGLASGGAVWFWIKSNGRLP